MRRGLLSLLVLAGAIGLAIVADRPTAVQRSLSSTHPSGPSGHDTRLLPRHPSPRPSPRPHQPAPCPEWNDGTPAPEAAPIAAKLAPYLLDPRLESNDVSVSVWIDGIGEVASLNGDQRLNVASNQKLLTAMGVLSEIDLGTTFHTSVKATSVDEAGVVAGDLVLVGGGDPTLTSTGPHSLTALAAAVRAAGVTEIQGRVLADESRYEAARCAPGWQDWQIPTYVGPLSAVIVDDNRRRVDPPFLADPARAHADSFRQRLIDAGISVGGPAATGHAPADAQPVVDIESSPVGDLLTRMLLTSDNEIAESLTREAGVLLAGSGSTAAGTAALEHGLLERCAPITDGRLGRWIRAQSQRLPIGARTAAADAVRANPAMVARTRGSLACRRRNGNARDTVPRHSRAEPCRGQDGNDHRRRRADGRRPCARAVATWCSPIS